MAIPIVESFTTAVSAGVATSLDISYPASIAADELLVVIIANDDATGTINFDAVSGWTKYAEGGNATTDCHIAVFYKVAVGTESGTQTFTSSQGNDELIGWMLRISKIGNVNGLDDVTFPRIGGGDGLSSTGAAPTDLNDVDSLLLFAWCFDGGDGFPFTTTNRGGGSGWANDPIPTNQELQENTDANTISGGWVTKSWNTGDGTSDDGLDVNASSTDGMVSHYIQIRGEVTAAAAATFLLMIEDGDEII